MKTGQERFCELVAAKGFVPSCLLPKEDGATAYHLQRWPMHVSVTIADAVFDDPELCAMAAQQVFRAGRVAG